MPSEGSFDTSFDVCQWDCSIEFPSCSATVSLIPDCEVKPPSLTVDTDLNEVHHVEATSRIKEAQENRRWERILAHPDTIMDRDRKEREFKQLKEFIKYKEDKGMKEVFSLEEEEEMYERWKEMNKMAALEKGKTEQRWNDFVRSSWLGR